ncbi:MAG: PhnD/SsuA/transferrin family substrate-binding protein [Sutterella sp.]|nr:PhnD/SsuA/transferrin family substrate-binding protein [Sutterella sp.]
MSRFHAASSFLFAAVAVLTAASAWADETHEAPAGAGVPAAERTLTVAVPDTLSEAFSSGMLSGTLRELEERLPGWRFEEKVFVSSDAVSALRQMHPDFIFEPAGFDAALPRESGVRPFRIATRKTVLARDAAHSSGSVIAVRADRTELKTMADLKGKRVAATLPMSVPGWLAALGEVRRSGLDPEHFFGEVRFLNSPFPNVLSALLEGTVDAAVLPACFLESLSAEGLADTSNVRILAEKTDSALSCRRSTALYPDVSLAAFDWTSEKAVRAVTVGILSVSGNPSYEWLSHVSHAEVEKLFHELRFGPYAYLNDNSPARLWKEWRNEILAAILMLTLLVANEIRLHVLVRRRTAELSRALEKQRASEREARASRLRLGSLERRSIVSQMSGMIAHEIKSPVAAISNFAAILEFILPEHVRKEKAARAALDGIAEEAQRISGIVDRVRAYSRSQQLTHRTVDLAAVVRRACRLFEMNQPEHVPVSASLPEKAPVNGDALELELLVLNLLKNAAQAAGGEENGKIAVSIETDGERWMLSVSDNGRPLDNAAFARLNDMLESVKPEGFGLGLSIVRGIADSHGGSLAFLRHPSGGLTVRFTIDRASEPGDPEKNS